MKFSYTSKDKLGELQSGVVEALSEAQAAKNLQAQGLFVLNIKEEGSGIKSGGLNIPFLGGRIPLKDKIIFTQQLAMMMNSGLPMLDAFNTLQEQTENKYFKKVIGEIAAQIRGGKPLSKSISAYPNIFSKFYIAMTGAGEKSGKLDEVLKRLAEELQNDYELMAKVKAAITYPILIMTALIGIVILMMIFVIPQLKKIFADMGVELPLITRVVLGTSDLMVNYWYIWLLLIVGLVVGLRFWTKTSNGGLIWDGLKLRIPVIGKLMRQIYMSRFCRTAGTLIASGLPILDIIKTTSEVMSNRLYQKALKAVATKIENGQTFSESIKSEARNIFPPMIYHLISVGEKSGKLDEILLTMARFFDRDVEATTNNLASLIEPILIIFVGAGVGLVVASVIMPIYSLVNVI